MKRTVPLLITAIVGLVLVCSAFVPAAEAWGEEAVMWFDMLAAIAFVLGGCNLISSQLKKISDRRKGWIYALVTLVAFTVTMGIGLLKVGIRPAANQEFYGESFASLTEASLPVTTLDGLNIQEESALQVPASARRIVKLFPDRIEVLGWLSPPQVNDLTDLSHRLDWKCAVEKVAAAAQPPGTLKGKLNYYTDHSAIGFRGVASPEDEAALTALAGDRAELQQAFKILVEQSRRTTALTVPEPPPGFEMPAALASRIQIESGSEPKWTVTGPLSSGDLGALTTGALRSRIAWPLGSEAASGLKTRIESGDPLNPDQAAVFDRLVKTDWSGDLLAAINTAGVSAPGSKSACQLVEERDRGVTPLDPVIPADPPALMNEAQETLIKSFGTSADHDWSKLEEQLKGLGTLTARQSAAIQRFKANLPTVGERHRRLFSEMLKFGPLTQKQKDALLADFQVEYQWKRAMVALVDASHTVKYPWSGEYNQQGSPFLWLFEYVYQPIQSMMFALLAFYVASAAFRAFRAKNLESSLLLGTAFIILLGRTPLTAELTAWLPADSPFRLDNLAVDIMRVFNSAGNRAIMIGIALGIASASIKILLGIDRSHIGGKD